MNRKLPIFVGSAVILTALDQITKWWIRDRLVKNRDSIDVIEGVFQLVHVENTGAAFGLLSGYEHAMWVFAGFTLVAVGVLISLYRELKPQETFMPLTLGLILSGAVGNAIDRVHKQGVTDFLRVYTDSPSLKSWLIETFGTNEYPSFNVADIAIVMGVGLFAIHEIRTAVAKKKEDGETPDTASSQEEPETPAPETTG